MTTPESSVKSRRGLARHKTNPFLEAAHQHTKSGMKRISNASGDRMMVVSGDGEVMATAGFWQAQEVDKTQFVKLYVNGVKAFQDLTAAGAKVFALLYMQVMNGIGKDVVYLSFSEVDQEVTPLSKPTFMRGMKELLEKHFIAETMTTGKYFINPDYMFNGDRLAFVKEYRLAGSKPGRDPRTIDAFTGRTDQESNDD